MSDSLRLRDRPGFVTVTWALAALGAAYEIAPASTATAVSRGLGVGPTAVGWLVSVMFGIAVVTSIPAGSVLARFGTRRALAAGLLLLAASGAASWYAARAGRYWPLLGCRVAAGAAYVLVWNAGLEAFGTFERRSTATGLFTASGPAGFALGHLTGPSLVARFGWESVLLVYPALTLPLLLGLVAATPVRGGGGGPTKSGGRVRIRTVVADRRFLAVCVVGFAAYSLYLFVNSWMPSFVVEEYGLSAVETGALVAVFPLVGIVSRTAGGVVTDRLFDGRKRPVVVASFAATVPSVAVLFLSTRVVTLVACLLASGFFVQLSLGLVYSYAPEIVGDGRAVTAVSVLTTVSLFGAFTAPTVAGWTIGVTGTYLAAFVYAAALAAVGLVASWRIVAPTR